MNFPCVYCDKEDHRFINWAKVISTDEWKKILSSERKCFNCAGEGHWAIECRSRGCRKCDDKHHMSICNKDGREDENLGSSMLCSRVRKAVVCPAVLVTVNGIKCWALLDTGPSSVYVSASLINWIRIAPKPTGQRSIEMLVWSMKSVDGKFKIPTEVSKAEKDTLLKVRNLDYPKLMEMYRYLQGVELLETESKKEYPIHVILGTSEYSNIKGCTKSWKDWETNRWTYLAWLGNHVSWVWCRIKHVFDTDITHWLRLFVLTWCTWVRGSPRWRSRSRLWGV